MKTFMRFQFEQDISLKAMQQRCVNDKKGLCCYKYDYGFDIDTPFMEQVIEPGETGEVIIFTGEVWGMCPEGYTVYPQEILERIKITCIHNPKTGYKKFKIIR